MGPQARKGCNHLIHGDIFYRPATLFLNLFKPFPGGLDAFFILDIQSRRPYQQIAVNGWGNQHALAVGPWQRKYGS